VELFDCEVARVGVEVGMELHGHAITYLATEESAACQYGLTAVCVCGRVWRLLVWVLYGRITVLVDSARGAHARTWIPSTRSCYYSTMDYLQNAFPLLIRNHRPDRRRGRLI
jgi:hypothetical protein